MQNVKDRREALTKRVAESDADWKEFSKLIEEKESVETTAKVRRLRQTVLDFAKLPAKIPEAEKIVVEFEAELKETLEKLRAAKARVKQPT